ncbi:hypothetical protein F444_11522, partial [Phytophthora nicotianae P1976]
FEADFDRRTPNNKKIYGKPMPAAEALQQFQWRQGHLNFRNLMPIRNTPHDRGYEPRFHSTSQVDSITAALPLLELHQQSQNDNAISPIYA